MPRGPQKITYEDKFCMDCQTVKNKSEFYKAGLYVQTRCKPCHNKYRLTLPRVKEGRDPNIRVRPQKKFEDLDEDLKNKIMEGLKTTKICPLSKQLNVSITHMRRWKNEGVFDDILSKYAPKRQIHCSWTSVDPNLKKQIIDSIQKMSLYKTAIDHNIPFKTLYRWRDYGIFNNIKLFNDTN